MYPAKTQSKFPDWYEKTNFQYLEWEGWNLPKSGLQNSDCGKWSWRGCLNHTAHADGGIRAQTFRLCCFRSSCPVCSEQWARRSTARIMDRLTHSKKNLKQQLN